MFAGIYDAMLIYLLKGVHCHLCKDRKPEDPFILYHFVLFPMPDSLNKIILFNFNSACGTISQTWARTSCNSMHYCCLAHVTDLSED